MMCAGRVVGRVGSVINSLRIRALVAGDAERLKRTEIRRRKAKRPSLPESSLGSRHWYESKGDSCLVCGRTRRSARLALHHAILEQSIRREGGDWYDTRVGMTLCESCHQAHHRRVRVIPLVLVPDSAIEFAYELLGPGAYDYLLRHYQGPDPRVDALLERKD